MYGIAGQLVPDGASKMFTFVTGDGNRDRLLLAGNGVAGEALLPLIHDRESPPFEVTVTEKQMCNDDALRFVFETNNWEFFDRKKNEQSPYNLEDVPDETQYVSAKRPKALNYK